MGGGRNQTKPIGEWSAAVSSSASRRCAVASGNGAKKSHALGTLQSQTPNSLKLSFGANFRSSEDATVARKLGKWLTVVPKEEEETARNGLNKQETASNKHSQPRPSTLFTKVPE